MNMLWIRGGNTFDIHATFGTSNNHYPLAYTINDYAEIHFAVYSDPFFYQ